jgi:hypothetical protein
MTIIVCSEWQAWSISVGVKTLTPNTNNWLPLVGAKAPTP